VFLIVVQDRFQHPWETAEMFEHTVLVLRSQQQRLNRN
jgi:hypothetical protein